MYLYLDWGKSTSQYGVPQLTSWSGSETSVHTGGNVQEQYRSREANKQEMCGRHQNATEGNENGR